MRRMRWRHQHVAAADVDFIFKTDRHRHGGKARGQFALVGHDGFHARGAAGRQNHDWIARLQHAGSELAGEAAKVWFGRETSWTGNRISVRFRSLAM